MKNKSPWYKKLFAPAYCFVIGLFLLIISPHFLSEGMFFDGVIYSSISKNLANGDGTFWNPHYTQTQHANFYEHPPLALGLQSLAFKIFGESRYVDKLFSVLIHLIGAIIMLQIWKQLGFKRSWSILLIYWSIPIVLWSSTNNLLESTLAIFTTLSVFFYIISLKGKKRNLYLFLSGFMLSFGFLSKGFVALFPLTLPLIYWLVYRKERITVPIKESAIVVLSSVLPLLLLFTLWVDAREFIFNYIDKQVINSIQNVETVGSRFYIIIQTAIDLLPAVAIGLLLLLRAQIKKIPLQKMKPDNKLALVFLLLASTGVIPIMISLKQSLFYVLATMPFFAISIGILINPLIEELSEKLKSSLIFKYLSYSLLLAGIVLCLYFSNKIGRDKHIIQDMHAIAEIVPENSIISVNLDLWVDWSLHAYYFRYHNISLDMNKRRQYLLLKKDGENEIGMVGYEKVNVSTEEYLLFEMKR